MITLTLCSVAHITAAQTFNGTCHGCPDYVPSNTVVDSCGVCMGDDTPSQEILTDKDEDCDGIPCPDCHPDEKSALAFERAEINRFKQMLEKRHKQKEWEERLEWAEQMGQKIALWICCLSGCVFFVYEFPDVVRRVSVNREPRHQEWEWDEDLGEEPEDLPQENVEQTWRRRPNLVLVETQDEDDQCIVCLTYKRDFACVPCGHMAYCGGCAEEAHEHTPRCPMCRQESTAPPMKIWHNA